jgi:hypothetical protein
MLIAPQYGKRQKERRNVSRFAALVASPASGSFQMPAGGKLRFVSTSGSAEGTTAAILTGATERTIKTPLLAAGEYVTLDFVEAGVEVALQDGFTCELDTGLAVWKTIAT